MKNWTWKQHFLFALALGFFTRALTSYFVYGAQSNDDYSHAILPTLEFFQNKPVTIPFYRSPLLVWTLIPFAQVGHWLGIDTQFGMIRYLLLCLGTASLTGLWAFYKWGKPLAGPLALYLLSLHFVMSFGSTRAFGESVAMTLTLISFLALDACERDSKNKKALMALGCISLGIACLYRFQIGVFAVGFGIYFLATRRWAQLGWLVIAGLVAMAIQSIVDIGFGRWPMETLYNYFYVNKDGAVEHSIQPWYNTWLTLIPIWLLPFSLPLFAGFRRITATEKLWLALIFFFVALHSMIPHKEERFLFPIVPLVLIMLARLWGDAWGTFYEKWIFRPIAGTVLGLTLAVSCFSNSQSGEYEPLLRAEALKEPVMIWENESTLRESNFFNRLRRPPIEYNDASHWPRGDEVKSLSGKVVFFVTSKDEHLEEWNQLQPEFESVGWTCKEPLKIQSVGDALLHKLNPKFNFRRKPTWLVECREILGGTGSAAARNNR